MAREDEIMLIAYNIWEEESCPNGRDYEHWFRAEVVWEEKQKQRSAKKDTDTESKQDIRQNANVVTAKNKSRKA